MGEWVPRSGYDRAGGYVWLPRLLDKTRRVLAGDAGEYYILEASPIDQAALKLWRVSGEQVRGWVREGLSDEAIAEQIRATGGVAPETFTRSFLLLWGPALLVFDADEGRLTGPAGAVLKGMVPVFLGVRRALVAMGVTRSA